jgi:hypothetical protein
VSTPISKMAPPSAASATSPRAHASNRCTLALAGPHQCTLQYDSTPCVLLHNNMPVLEDGTSRLEVFSSTRVGANMKHVHTFGCPVFALQKHTSFGQSFAKMVTSRAPWAQSWTKPNARKQCVSDTQPNYRSVSPQYHWCVDNFFQTTVTINQMFLAPSAGSD